MPSPLPAEALGIEYQPRPRHNPRQFVEDTCVCVCVCFVIALLFLVRVFNRHSKKHFTYVISLDPCNSFKGVVITAPIFTEEETAS